MTKKFIAAAALAAFLCVLIPVAASANAMAIEVARSITAAYVWTSADIATTTEAPLSANPETIGHSLGTTPLDVTASAPAAGVARNADFATTVRVVNRHASQFVCLGAVAWATSCAASGFTCSAHATTDGSVVLPSGVLVRVFDGTLRPCIVASGAATTTQTDYVRRKAQ